MHLFVLSGATKGPLHGTSRGRHRKCIFSYLWHLIYQKTAFPLKCNDCWLLSQNSTIQPHFCFSLIVFVVAYNSFFFQISQNVFVPISNDFYTSYKRFEPSYCIYIMSIKQIEKLNIAFFDIVPNPFNISGMTCNMFCISVFNEWSLAVWQKNEMQK